MANHAYQRTDADGNVLASFDFPGMAEPPIPTMDEKIACFAIEQAIFKMIAEDVNTKSVGNLRSEIDDHYLDLYRSTGAKSFAVRLNGEEVGVASIKGAAPRRQKSSTTKAPTVWMVTDEDALIASENDDFNDFIKQYVRTHIGEIAIAYVKETGEKLNGIEEAPNFEPPVEPAKPSVSIRIYEDRVADVVGAQALGGIIHGMLGGE